MDDPKVRRERGEEGKGKEGKRGGYRYKKQDETGRDKRAKQGYRCRVCVVPLGWVDDDGLEMQTSF